jgi:NitT/TauT family transport system permease protein
VTTEAVPFPSSYAQTRRRIARGMGPALIGLLFIVAWEAGVRLAHVPMWLLPSPSEIVVAAWRIRAQLPAHIAATLSSTLLGFGCAVAIGVPLAALLASSDFVRRLLGPVLAGVQAIPKNALAPIFILWFGGGALSKIAITFLISFFPIVINAADGMLHVDRDMIRLSHTLRASRLQVFWHIRAPNALPALLSGCKIAVTLAIIGAVIGEFVASDQGLGYLILISSSQLQTDVAFVAIVALAICGIVLFYLVSLLETLVMPWLIHSSTEDANELAV